MLTGELKLKIVSNTHPISLMSLKLTAIVRSKVLNKEREEKLTSVRRKLAFYVSFVERVIDKAK
ncbi:hypothetical protein [Bacillus sp. es.036]|uniref:hypothetical protein n=1 Tax=Bacillus sp. es.036 TaxID=1761764 RepID=UPI000BFA1B23|nr:hypothetical protein [Bacillus sp. es.036]PFG12276.1 hypothetical protein ATG70_0453 [Bacillus sp. es.036]